MMEDKLTQVRYLPQSQIDKLHPDANILYRFKTTFLTSISSTEIQTSDGVILLTEECNGQKLAHNDCIMVLARCAMKGRFEGSVRKVDHQSGLRFEELCKRRLGVEQQQAEVVEEYGHF